MIPKLGLHFKCDKMHNNLALENDRRFIFLLDLRYIFFSPSSELFQNYRTCILQRKQGITSFSAKLIGHLDQYLSALDCSPVPAFILQHVSFQDSSFIFPFTLFYFLQTDILGQCLPPLCHTFNLYNIFYALVAHISGLHSFEEKFSCRGFVNANLGLS